MQPPTRCDAWKGLSTHYEAIERLHLRDLFARDPGRGERLTAEGVGLFLDYSKNRITDRTIELLIELAEESGLRSRIDAMFRGDTINITENRAVLHVPFAHRRTRRLSSMERTLWSGVHAVLESDEEPTLNHDSSTNTLIRRWRLGSGTQVLPDDRRQEEYR